MQSMQTILTGFCRRIRLIGCGILCLAVVGCGLLPEVKDETTGWSAQKLYTEAKDAMDSGSFDKAIKLFEKLESRYPYGRYAQQAQLEAAYAYYKSGEQTMAVAACDRFIRLHPNHANVDYAYYLKGLANFNEDLGLLGYLNKQDQTERDPRAARDALEAFKELITRFPTSKYAQDSAARSTYLLNALAAHEVHVARYYYRRGAFIAATNRAQQVIKVYPETPSTEEALFIMVKAYEALGLKDLRDDAERVLRKNFPSSQFWVKGLDPMTPWWKFW
jgi:outer membrane protein assembly factor BamD